MRALLVALLYAASSFGLASGPQAAFLTPIQSHTESEWDKEPNIDATGNRIFTSVSELMQLWPGTVVVQGHSLAPCTIPIGTVFYHGRGDPNIPTTPEWLAFDFEHSYMFAFGRVPHVLTFATKRELHVLDFDGLSAHMSPDTQSVIMYGEVRKNNTGWIPTEEIGERLCSWGKKNGIDGFIRMEGHFELIECDFNASFDLLSALPVIPQEERTKDGDGRRGPGGRFPAQRPEGWVGSLPTDSRGEVTVTGQWHSRAPGETRVRVRYDKFVSFYDPKVTSLVASRRCKPREKHDLKPISKLDTQMKLAELEDALARPWDAGSGVDWASVVHVVIERYGERLEVLARTLSNDTEGVADEVAFKARQQVLIMLTPHFTTSDTPPADGAGNDNGWLAPVVQRCASTHTRGLPVGLMTVQEKLIKSAVEDVMQEICRRLARMFYLSYDLEDRLRSGIQVADAMRVEVKALMRWLDWAQVWVKCEPGCAAEEICVVSTGGGRGPQGDGGAGDPTEKILSKIPPNDSKLTYVWEEFLFHYISEGGFTYLVMADDSAGRRMPFAFLADLQRKFAGASSSSASTDTPAHGLQGSFGPVIADLMHTYNTAPPADELARAQTELNQVKNIMVQNVEQILSRGERIELLVDKTDVMAGQATAFRRGARSVRRQMWWRNTKIMALCVLVGLVFLWIFVAQFCGAGLNQCGSKKKESSS
ncbi:vesicle-associated membrane protein [Favolaschia claudopus]|uniref:Synaptobrevin homolog YKT6 n=1 Tax=Favolaschia claudopus TaxID=2862362 RepID=A0AAW0DMB4_9AGAR